MFVHETKRSSYFYTLLYNVLGKPMGLLLSVLIAYYFGTGKEIDVYFWVILFVNMYYSYTLNNWGTAIVPLMVDASVKEPAKLRDFQGFIIFWGYLTTIVTGIVLYAFARLFVMHFTQFSPATKLAAVAMLKLALPFYIFTGFYSINVSLVNALTMFKIPTLLDTAVKPALTIVIFVLLVKRYSVTSLIIANNTAQFLIWFILSWVLIKKDILSLRLTVFFEKRHVVNFLRLLLPYYCFQILESSIGVFSRYMLSGFAIGAIAFINYSERVIGLIIGTLTSNLSLIMFSEYSYIASKESKAKLLDSYKRSIFLVWLFIIPLSVYLFAFGDMVVGMLLQRGNFSRISTLSTALALKYMSIGMFATAAHTFTAKVFSALKDANIGFYTLLPSSVVMVFSYYYFGMRLGYIGIAAAASFNAVFNFCLLLLALNLRHEKVGFSAITSKFLQFAVISAVVNLGLKIALNAYNVHYLELSFWSLLSVNCVVFAVFTFLITAIYYMLKVPEFMFIVNNVIDRISPRLNAPSSSSDKGF